MTARLTQQYVEVGVKADSVKARLTQLYVEVGCLYEDAPPEYDDSVSVGGIVFGGEVVEVGEKTFTDGSVFGGIVFGGGAVEGGGEDEIHQVDGDCAGGVVFGGTVDEQWEAEPNNYVAVKGGTFRINGEIYTKTASMSFPGVGTIAALVDCGEPPTTSGYYRYDLLSIDASGTITVTAGTESATPVMPTTPANEIKLDHVLRYYGQETIVQADIGKVWTAPQIVSMAATIADDVLSWGENSTTIQIRCYDQYGKVFTGSRTVTAAITSGNGTLSPASKSGSGSYFTFTYTRNGDSGDVSPLLTFTHAASGAFTIAMIQLLDAGGGLMV